MIFSVVNGLMLNPRDYPQLERLVMVRELVPPLQVPQETTVLNFTDWRAQAKSFEGGLVGTTNIAFNLTGIGEPLMALGGAVSANFLTFWASSFTSAGDSCRGKTSREKVTWSSSVFRSGGSSSTARPI